MDRGWQWHSEFDHSSSQLTPAYILLQAAVTADLTGCCELHRMNRVLRKNVFLYNNVSCGLVQQFVTRTSCALLLFY